MTLWLLLFLAVQTAMGRSQSRFDTAPGIRTQDFVVHWQDAHGQQHQVGFSLPMHAIRSDQGEVTYLKRKKLNQAMVAAVRQTNPNTRPKVNAQIIKGQVRIEVSGATSKKQAQNAMAAAEQAADQAALVWLRDHDFTTLRDGSISFDHPGLVTQYAPDLVPVARALQQGTSSQRAFIEKALSFVQAIPYETRHRKGTDPGYRRPLALLAQNKGDCDSKTVLFLSIVRAAYPDLGLAVVYVPQHVLAGVQLAPTDGDRTFKHNGTNYLYAEPVGPGLHPLGEPADENRKAAKKGEVRAVSD